MEATILLSLIVWQGKKSC